MEKVMDIGYSVAPLQSINDMLPRETLPVRKYQKATLAGWAAPSAV
jgi:hypothetical protein